ncbi:hypothetical protein P3T36_006364 [Kitasatospora sp. MAP12-15]|uniref:hypothetical protein n=1 Tax=unclassified Kitasatospora TaxID=2633591 RepID=UPI002474A34F|nr:hypothetical protein [Kitasatospora sp. MAP12-44]MDH6107905.1 hypothetical protein [Kitasatospora sp. MAP12-44]
MSTHLPEDLDQRLAAELVPQCPAPPARRRTGTALPLPPPADPRAAEHRAELLAALRPTTRTAASSPRETAA